MPEINRMSDAEYQIAQDQVLFFAQLLAISPIDLDAMSDRISLAISAGAVLNPTLYMRGCERLVAMRDFVSALKKAKAAAMALHVVVSRTAEEVA
jgi:hypothetical protein